LPSPPPHLLTALQGPPTITGKLVLLAMALEADEDGHYRLGASHLARVLGLHRWATLRAVHRLERLRWIRATLRRPGRATHYRLHLTQCASGAAPPLPPSHPLHDLDRLRALVRGHPAYQAAVHRGAPPDDLFGAVLERLTVREGRSTRWDPERGCWSTYVHKVVHSVCSNETRRRANHPEHHCTTSIDDMET
jgi:hypothetical protein